MPASSFTALSRENLLRLLEEPDFFAKNPALQAHEQEIAACRAAYLESKKSSSCSCGGNSKILVPCFEALLATLDGMQQTDPAAVITFIEYVTKRKTGAGRVCVSIYYTKDNGTAPHRYEFIA